MSFISVYYLVFLASVTVFYYLLPAKYRTLWLLGASYFFYLTWQPAFLPVLIGVTAAAYLFGQKLAPISDPKRKKKWLAGSVTVLLLPLAFFKYYNFLNENLAAFVSRFSFDSAFFNQPYLVPLGVSFFTFQAVSYVVDIYRGYLAPEKSVSKFALYMAFFPTLLAGPIERAKAILNQLDKPAEFEYQNFRAGLQLILWGVFKKVVLADRMADFLNRVYAEPGNFQGLIIYLAAVLTMLQVFCDFSAYSDIAVGSARMVGIELTKNFDDRVYAAESREIFWKGWHRSLTAWMRDYVFFPLSRRRKNKTALYANLVVVYFLIGLWHGPTWGFVTWGLLNGLWLVGENASKAWRQKFFANIGIDTSGRIFNFLAWLLIFHVGGFFGVFFRTETPLRAFNFLGNLANRNANLIASPELRACLLTIGLLFLMDLINRRIPPNRNFDAFIGTQPVWLRWGIYILLAELILRYIYVFDNAPFVYFNF